MIMASRETADERSTCREMIECDGTRKKRRDKRSEHLIERLKRGRVLRIFGGGGRYRPWMRGRMRGGTLKGCQSDFKCVLFPPLLVYVVGSFGSESFRGFWREQ